MNMLLCACDYDSLLIDISPLRPLLSLMQHSSDDLYDPSPADNPLAFLQPFHCSTAAAVEQSIISSCDVSEGEQLDDASDRKLQSMLDDDADDAEERTNNGWGEDLQLIFEDDELDDPSSNPSAASADIHLPVFNDSLSLPLSDIDIMPAASDSTTVEQACAAAATLSESPHKKRPREQLEEPTEWELRKAAAIVELQCQRRDAQDIVEMTAAKKARRQPPTQSFPDDVLGVTFSFSSLQDLHSVVLVCRSWHKGVFKMPLAKAADFCNFKLSDEVLSRIALPASPGVLSRHVTSVKLYDLRASLAVPSVLRQTCLVFNHLLHLDLNVWPGGESPEWEDVSFPQTLLRFSVVICVVPRLEEEGNPFLDHLCIALARHSPRLQELCIHVLRKDTRSDSVRMNITLAALADMRQLRVLTVARILLRPLAAVGGILSRHLHPPSPATQPPHNAMAVVPPKVSRRLQHAQRLASLWASLPRITELSWGLWDQNEEEALHCLLQTLENSPAASIPQWISLPRRVARGRGGEDDERVVSDRVARLLPILRHLQTFHTRCCYHSIKDFNFLARLPALTELEIAAPRSCGKFSNYFVPDWNMGIWDKQMSELSTPFPLLKSLKLSDTNLGTQHLTKLLSLMPLLDTVDIQVSRLSSLNCLLPLKTTLRCLSLRGIKVDSMTAPSEVERMMPTDSLLLLESFPFLTELQLRKQCFRELLDGLHVRALTPPSYILSALTRFQSFGCDEPLPEKDSPPASPIFSRASSSASSSSSVDSNGSRT
jgi:hypothetical protein